MSRERRIYVGIFGVAIAGLAVDRFVLAPSSAGAAPVGIAEAAVAAPGSSTASAPAKPAAARIGSALRTFLSDEIEPDKSDLAGQLAFGPAPEWTAVAQPEPRIRLTSTASDAGEPQPTQTALPASLNTPHKLTMVMPTASGGMAVIDGVTVRVGQQHPSGFRLIAVGDRTVTIESDGRTVTLSMAGPR